MNGFVMVHSGQPVPGKMTWLSGMKELESLSPIVLLLLVGTLKRNGELLYISWIICVRVKLRQ